MPPLTPALLRDAALAAGGYATPALNEVLVLSRSGVASAGAALAAYAGLHALHLDGNAVASVTDMPCLPGLKCLYEWKGRGGGEAKRRGARARPAHSLPLSLAASWSTTSSPP
jgi:hypothetical protein